MKMRMHFILKAKDETLMKLLSATMFLYRRAHELQLTKSLKILEDDVKVIYYLVTLLDDKKENE